MRPSRHPALARLGRSSVLFLGFLFHSASVRVRFGRAECALPITPPSLGWAVSESCVSAFLFAPLRLGVSLSRQMRQVHPPSSARCVSLLSGCCRVIVGLLSGYCH